MIIQGTNAPIVIEFDQAIDQMSELVISVWAVGGALVKMWEKDEIGIEGAIATCPLTEEETKAFPNTVVTIEAKGIDESGEMVFWDQMDVKVLKRRDKVISLIGE